MDDIAKMKVLVCDDEALARMRLKRLVEMANMEVSAEAASGREAVESAGRLRPDVVLMDIRMPDMDGLEAAAHLDKMENPPAVIFCTAYEEHALQAFRVHAVDYLLKPVGAQDLKRALDKARALNRVQIAELSHKMAANQSGRRRHLSAHPIVSIAVQHLSSSRAVVPIQSIACVTSWGGHAVGAQVIIVAVAFAAVRCDRRQPHHKDQPLRHRHLPSLIISRKSADIVPSGNSSIE